MKELEGQLEELIASEQDLHLVQSPSQSEGLGENQIIDEESVQDAPDYRLWLRIFQMKMILFKSWKKLA